MTAVDSSVGERLVRDHTIHAAVIGSRAYGLATDCSDTDVRGVYVAPTPLFWSLTKPPTHVDEPDQERFSWEVERFCGLALKANPTALEVLWSPLVVRTTPIGAELVGLRQAFLCQRVHETFTAGYASSQRKRLQADLRRHGVPRWQHAMHLIRALLLARDLLVQGQLQLDVGGNRDRLLAVRRGELPWEAVEQWRSQLLGEIDAALVHTSLPVAPDTARIDAWLQSVRARSAAEATP